MCTLDELIIFLEKRAQKLSLDYSTHSRSVSEKCNAVNNREDFVGLIDSLDDTKKFQALSNKIIALLKEVSWLKHTQGGNANMIHDEIIHDLANKTVKQNIAYDYSHPLWGYPPFICALIFLLKEIEAYEKCAELNKLFIQFSGAR